ncbi:hypothetical protein [Argonema antarcticum]|uniref:hypothetical protein n=1 Tax=Argonema antarcticum TaxID=2942763 RepID=UPI002012A75A|nr:hypothetical protein [Argonema antarcticum]MCL1474182.1 hypothetical protein [Argonema antarcticum A004/B2]
MNHPPDPMIIILIVVNAIIFWFLFSRSWLSLAKLYKTNQPPPHNIRRMRQGYVGWIRYRGALNIGITHEGIYLSIMRPFNIGTPPLLIPWRAIDRIEKVTSFFVQSYRLHLKDNKTTLILNKEDLEGSQLYYRGQGIELL